MKLKVGYLCPTGYKQTEVRVITEGNRAIVWNLTASHDYQNLLEQISDIYTQGRIQALQTVNLHITETYWQVGRHIVEFEQNGKIRADYGKALIVGLGLYLKLRHGKGFSRSNLIRIRQSSSGCIQKVRRCRTF